MQADGTCPTCGHALERRRLPVGDSGVGAGGGAAEPEEDVDVAPRAPWHFKVLLIALIVYLAWRGVQGIDWLVGRL